MGRYHDPILGKRKAQESCVTIAAIAAIVLCLLAATEANSYPTPVDFDGALLRWHVSVQDPPITYEVLADQPTYITEYRDGVDSAAAMWSTIPTSYFRYAPVPDGQKAQVTIHLASKIDGGDYSAGYAIFDEYEGMKPEHCAIFVLIEDDLSMRSMEKTFLHELGHCLGLGHTLIPQAIMSYRLDANRFALDVDDRAAASRLYPIDGSNPKIPPGCATGALRQASGNPSRNAVELAFFLLVPFFFGGISRKVRCRATSRRRSLPSSGADRRI